MSVKPCTVKVNSCLPCLDWPVENLSIEGPDNPTYLSLADWDPPAPISYKRQGCLSWCFSTVSQAEADACAAAQAALCSDDTGTGGPDGDLPSPGTPPDLRPGGGYVYNDAQRIGCGPLGEEDESIALLGVLPPGYFIDNTALVIAAGVIPVSTNAAPDAKAAANSLARDALFHTFDYLLANGTITCDLIWTQKKTEWDGTGWYQSTEEYVDTEARTVAITANPTCVTALVPFYGVYVSECRFGGDVTVGMPALTAVKHVKIDYTWLLRANPLTAYYHSVSVFIGDPDGGSVVDVQHNGPYAGGNESGVGSFEFDTVIGVPWTIEFYIGGIRFDLGTTQHSPGDGTLTATVTIS